MPKYYFEDLVVGGAYDEIRWLKPVRPGDTLHLRAECVETAASRSRPDRGRGRFRYEVKNQRGEVVMTMIGMGLFRRRGF